MPVGRFLAFLECQSLGLTATLFFATKICQTTFANNILRHTEKWTKKWTIRNKWPDRWIDRHESWNSKFRWITYHSPIFNLKMSRCKIVTAVRLIGWCSALLKCRWSHWQSCLYPSNSQKKVPRVCHHFSCVFLFVFVEALP